MRLSNFFCCVMSFFIGYFNEIRAWQETTTEHTLYSFYSVDHAFNSTLSPTTNALPRYIEPECSIVASTENVALTVFFVFVLMGSVFGNLLVFAAFFLSSKLRMSVTSYFILSLACADILFAIIVIPFHISNQLNVSFCNGLSGCFIYLTTDVVCNLTSILSLFLIAVDRFMAITKPFRYQILMRKKRALQLIIVSWALSALWALTGIFNWKSSDNNIAISISKSVSGQKYCSNVNYLYHVITFVAFFFVPLVIMLYMYLGILHVALKHIREIEATHVTPQTSNALDDRRVSNEAVRRNANRKRKEFKATRSVCVVYFAFLFCWLPSLIINTIIMVNVTYFPSLQLTHPELHKFIYYTGIKILPTLNCMLNPIIYSLSNTLFRAAIRQIYTKLARKTYAGDNSFDVSSTRRTTHSSIEGCVNSPKFQSNHKLSPLAALKTKQPVNKAEHEDTGFVNDACDPPLWSPD